MEALSRRKFLSSMGISIASGGLAGMSMREALAQPVEKLAENVPSVIYGRTGFKTKIIGFGTLFYTIPDTRDGFLSEKESDRLINTTLDLGINLIETGLVYKDGEDKLGRVLPKRRREEIFLSSKSLKRTKDEMLKDIETSLTRLKTDYLDMYCLHACSTLEAYNTAAGEGGAVEALKQAQEEGKIRFIGITGHGISTMMTAMRYGDFDSHLIAYNAVNREWEKVLDLAATLNKTVMIMKPYGASGNDWRGGGGILNPAPENHLYIQKKILSDEECMRFVLSHPGVTIAVPGLSTIEYLKRNIAIAATYKPLTPQERNDIIAKGDRIAGGVCGECKEKPCEKVCHNQVPVSYILSSLQYAQRFSFARWQRRPIYNALDRDYLDCDNCGECEKVCPQKFEICDKMKEAHDRLVRLTY